MFFHLFLQPSNICSIVANKIQHLRIMICVMILGVLVAQPAQALSNAFPQYPLITGGGTRVLPNVLLILDDSGSMRSAGIPETIVNWNKVTLNDVPLQRSYIYNELYYNPEKTYKPWRTASIGNDERLPNADYKNVAYSTIYLNGNSINLAGHTESYFFIPKPNITNPGNDRTNYYKYRISPQGKIQKCSDFWNDCGHYSRWRGDGSGWKDELPPNNQGRDQVQEVQNFANFYHYHRSRMKVAKAGISEAFGRLGEDLRVGYNNLGNTGGIRYSIPIAQYDGQFKGINRTQFYNYVQNEKDPHGTPTREALNRAGLYFKTDAPYRTRPNSPPLSCRRNYALLVTDGDWNGEVHYPIWTDNRLRCGHLACIAKHYWKTDLRPDLPDEVPVNGADSANWQHMNTFSISIGLKGTLDVPAAGPTERNKPLSNAWPKPINAASKTDDLMHAAVEGRGNFIVASDTESFAKALTDALTAINNRQASSSVITASSAQISSDTVLFGASFKSGTWSGDLVARKLNTSGLGFASKPDWVLSETFKPGGVNEHFKDRGITRWISYNDKVNKININQKLNFSKLLSYMSKEYIARYARSSGIDAVSAEDNIAWLRGDQSKERKNGGNLRNRVHPIGDIVHSTVAYVKNEQKWAGVENDMVFVGANDGMLHAIDAGNGKVIYSYIPRGVDEIELAKLSSPTYEHRFFVDGDIDIDTDFRRYPEDRHMLLGSLGRGGRGVFMLSAITYASSRESVKVVFDNTLPPSDTTTDPNMGYVLGQIRLRRDNRARTWAIVPNGIDSPDGKAVLFAYELGNRNEYIRSWNIKKYELIADKDNTTKDNGLMAISVADTNGDGHFDVVYGGDLKGNVWRWDFTGEEPGQAVKIFQAKDAKGNPQPITGGLSYAREPGVNGRHFVGFGTGRYISTGDMPQAKVIAQVQSVYGIIDQTGNSINAISPLISGRSELQERKIAYIGLTTRSFGKHEDLPEDKKGWYLDLPDQERVISQPSLFHEAMYFISAIPPLAGSDECGTGSGSSYLNAIHLFTGTGSYNTSQGYFSGYPSISLGNEEISVGSIKLTGLQAGLTLMQTPSGNTRAAVGNPNGDEGQEDESGKSGGEIIPTMDMHTHTQIKRIQWRSLL